MLAKGVLGSHWLLLLRFSAERSDGQIETCPSACGGCDTKLNIPILDINCTTKIYNGQMIYKINSFSVVGNLMVLTPIGYICVIN